MLATELDVFVIGTITSLELKILVTMAVDAKISTNVKIDTNAKLDINGKIGIDAKNKLMQNWYSCGNQYGSQNWYQY